MLTMCCIIIRIIFTIEINYLVLNTLVDILFMKNIWSNQILMFPRFCNTWNSYLNYEKWINQIYFRYRSSNSESGRSTPQGRTLSRTNLARKKEVIDNNKQLFLIYWFIPRKIQIDSIMNFLFSIGLWIPKRRVSILWNCRTPI